MEWLVVIMYAVLFALSGAKDADAATQGSVSYLHGDGYVSGDTTRNVSRFDVLNINKLGVIYGRADILSGDDSNSSVLTRIIGHYGTGLHLAAQAQNQARVSQTNAGVGYSVFTKNTSWFVDLYKVNSNYYGDAYAVFGYGSVKLTDNIKADGFIEYTKPDNTAFQPVLFAQPSLSYQVFDGVWLGVEQQRYFNKAGVRGLDEVVNQVKLKWEF